MYVCMYVCIKMAKLFSLNNFPYEKHVFVDCLFEWKLLPKSIEIYRNQKLWKTVNFGLADTLNTPDLFRT